MARKKDEDQRTVDGRDEATDVDMGILGDSCFRQKQMEGSQHQKGANNSIILPILTEYFSQLSILDVLFQGYKT